MNLAKMVVQLNISFYLANCWEYRKKVHAKIACGKKVTEEKPAAIFAISKMSYISGSMQASTFILMSWVRLSRSNEYKKSVICCSAQVVKVFLSFLQKPRQTLFFKFCRIGYNASVPKIRVFLTQSVKFISSYWHLLRTGYKQ